MEIQAYPEDLTIKSGIKGDDLPIDFFMLVKPKNQVVQFISKLPFEIPRDIPVEGSIAVNVANYGLLDGSFDYDIKDGSIMFRLTSSYRDSNLGPELFEYMIMVSASTIDNYNDKFFMLAKEKMTLAEFIEAENS